MLRSLLFYLLLIVASVTYGQDKIGFLSDGTNSISLRVTAYGKDAKNAAANAKLSAIKTVLFRGIPGSNLVENPMVGVDEAEIQKKHSKYFDELFGKGRYESFILSDVAVSSFAKDATKKKSITLDLKVNLKALRSDLEQHNVIRKFGF